MKHFKYLIVGGGISAGYAAKEFTEHEAYQNGDLAIITKDNAVPYERPPLSKDFLAGEEDYADIQINEPDFYRKHGISLFLYTRVNKIDTKEKMVHTDHGDIFHYDKLMLATGSSPVTLDVLGADHSRIKYLRTLDDAREIRADVNDAKHIVVVGGGYIGMETAAAMTQSGHQVTMVFPEDRLMERLFTPRLSAYFEDYYQQQGIDFVKGVTVTGFSPSDSHSISVKLSDGETLSADLVVVGIGASPNLQLAKDANLDIRDDGVEVNNRLQSSAEDVYVAGDIANYFDRIFNKRRRVEHWQNAVDTAQYIAREMLGVKQDDFQTLRYFFSDIFDLSYEFWGDTAGADDVRHIGDLNEDSIGVWWLKGNHLIAALLMDRPDEERSNAQEWITNLQPINRSMFEDTIRAIS